MKPQQDLIDFSLSKTISIARPSAQIHLVDRIFETSNEFDRRLIVTFIKTNADIPSSSSEGERYVLKRTRRLIVGYIYSSNSEGAHECNIELIKLFGDIKLFKRSKLNVNYILIPSFEEAQQDAPAQQAASSTILKLIDALFFEGARVDLISTQWDSQLIVECSKISHHFRKDCGIFREGVKDDEGVFVKQQSANIPDAVKKWRHSSNSNDDVTCVISSQCGK